MANSYPHLQNLKIPQLPVENIELSIGCNAHETFKVIEQRCGAFGEPLVFELGWDGASLVQITKHAQVLKMFVLLA